MAVRMVVHQPAAEPEHAIDAEVRAQLRLDVAAREVRVAVRIEQALLGGDGEAGAVDVDRAALQDPVGAADVQARALAEPAPDRVVAGQVIFAAPAVEARS